MTNTLSGTPVTGVSGTKIVTLTCVVGCACNGAVPKKTTATTERRSPRIMTSLAGRLEEVGANLRIERALAPASGVLPGPVDGYLGRRPLAPKEGTTLRRWAESGDGDRGMRRRWERSQYPTGWS